MSLDKREIFQHWWDVTPGALQLAVDPLGVRLFNLLHWQITMGVNEVDREGKVRPATVGVRITSSTEYMIWTVDILSNARSPMDLAHDFKNPSMYDLWRHLIIDMTTEMKHGKDAIFV